MLAHDDITLAEPGIVEPVHCKQAKLASVRVHVGVR